MTEDRVYPSTKPILNPPSSHQTLNGGTNNNPPPSFPPTKSQLYGASRPTYRPQPKQYHQKRSRSCCCSCCLWTTFIIIALILLTAITGAVRLLTAITGAVFYVIYRPHRPSFSVTTLRIPQFNITTSSSKDSSSSHLNSKLDFTISARNPNKKVVFYYDPIIVSVKSNGIEIGDGSFPSLIHETKNTTLLKASLTSSSAKELDSVSVNSLKSDLKKKSGLPLDIQLDTKVRVKMGGLKTKKVGIRVSCSGIHAVVAKTSKASSSTNADCKVKLRIKIWKWTIG